MVRTEREGAVRSEAQIQRCLLTCAGAGDSFFSRKGSYSSLRDLKKCGKKTFCCSVLVLRFLFHKLLAKPKTYSELRLSRKAPLFWELSHA